MKKPTWFLALFTFFFLVAFAPLFFPVLTPVFSAICGSIAAVMFIFYLASTKD